MLLHRDFNPILYKMNHARPRRAILCGVEGSLFQYLTDVWTKAINTPLTSRQNGRKFKQQKQHARHLSLKTLSLFFCVFVKFEESVYCFIIFHESHQNKQVV